MPNIIQSLGSHLPSFAKLVSVGRKGASNKLTNETNCYKSDFWGLISESHDIRKDCHCCRIFSQLQQAIVGSPEKWRKKQGQQSRERWGMKSGWKNGLGTCKRGLRGPGQD